jgi:hypothetical protein
MAKAKQLRIDAAHAGVQAVFRVAGGGSKGWSDMFM